MLGILSAGIAPGLAILTYFYLRDEYESEPFSMVLRVFISGVLLVFPIMFIQYVFEIEGVIRSNFYHAFFSAGLLEEFFKWFILFYTVYKQAEFDEPYDGIVYGVAVSLGFATAENILYLFVHGLDTALGRALLPVSSHALFGVMMGYYLGKGKFSNGPKVKWLILSLFLPFLLHGIYDFILISIDMWLVFILPFMIFLWWFALRKAKTARLLTIKKNTHANETLPL